MSINFLINAAFNTGVLTLLFFIAGMIKPKWPLFFMNKPDRFLIAIITTILVMITVTMYGEGNRRALEEERKTEAEKAAGNFTPSPAPQPEGSIPVPAPQTPAK